MMCKVLDKRLKKDYVGMGAYVVYGGPRTIELTDQNGRKIEVSKSVSVYFPVRGVLIETDDTIRGKIRKIADDGSSDCLYWFLIEVHENCTPYVLTGDAKLIWVSWDGMDTHHMGLLVGCVEGNDAVVLEFRHRADRRYRMGVLVLMGPRYPWELSGVAVAVGHQTYRATGVSRSPRGEG